MLNASNTEKNSSYREQQNSERCKKKGKKKGKKKKNQNKLKGQRMKKKKVNKILKMAPNTATTQCGPTKTDSVITFIVWLCQRRRSPKVNCFTC